MKKLVELLLIFVLFNSIQFFIKKQFVMCSQESQVLSCYLNDEKHNSIVLQNNLVFDTDNETWINLRSYEIKEFESSDNPYIKYEYNRYQDNYFRLGLLQIDEKTEITRGSSFYYNTTIRLNCTDGNTVNMYIKVPLIDTNNHKPFFEKPTYIYNLISSYAEDFKRQQLLNPIIATDYDVTNTALEFTIDENEYFDIISNGIVPNSINKKHFALLTPKVPGKLVTKKIEVIITVQDVGYPPQKNVTKLIIIPPSPPRPVFLEPFYIGHSFRNNTFVMAKNPQLLEGCTFYKTRVDVLTSGNKSRVFYAEIVDNIIFIKKFKTQLGYFFEKNYTAYELKAVYTDPTTELYSTGSATFIVEDHQDL